MKTRAKRAAPVRVTPATAQVIFVNHSGGKDSQAMLNYLVQQGHGPKIVVIHADLGEMEHEPMLPWITSIAHGLPVHNIVPPRDFFTVVRDAGRFPAGLHKFCSGRLKTEPLNKFIVDYMESRGLTHALTAVGIRHSEGGSRKHATEFHRAACDAPTKNRNVTQWNPILKWSVEDVFSCIASHNQKPHAVYARGWSRLSCTLCVYASKDDHKRARAERPELFAKFVQLEADLGKSIRMWKRKSGNLNQWLKDLE